MADLSTQIKEFNKKYKINSELQEKVKFAHDNDAKRSGSIAGKPKKMGIEILKRFFTNPIVVIFSVVFIVLILMSIIIPATSPYKAGIPINDSTYNNSLPPAYTSLVTDYLDYTDKKYLLIEDIRKANEAGPYKGIFDEFFATMQIDESLGLKAKVSYNPYLLMKYFTLWEWLKDPSKIFLNLREPISAAVSQLRPAETIEYTKVAISSNAVAAVVSSFVPSYYTVLGTSDTGWDIWVTTWKATWNAFTIAVLVSFAQVIIGVSIGAYLGFNAGKQVDTIVMRLIDIFTSPPTIVWMLMFVTILGANTWALIAALIIVGWPSFVSLTRMYIITVKNQEYITAAKAIGATSGRQIFIHAFPAIVGKIANSFVRTIPATIMWIASLAFLGFLKSDTGVNNLGELLIKATPQADQNAWILILPTLILLLLSMSLYFIALGLHDALDPRVMSKKRR
ncbi:ABC transporter permease [[Mycoplasma] falconis]|nr:ABC transporter permease [[Mycoplasma] falconis]